MVASWNIADTFLNGARGDELAAQVDGVRAQRIGMHGRRSRTRSSSAELDVGKAQTALETSEVAMRAAEEAYRVTTDLFRVGRATTTDLIDAETELLGAKLDGHQRSHRSRDRSAAPAPRHRQETSPHR